MRPHAKRLRGHSPRSRRRELARLYRASKRGGTFHRNLLNIPEHRALVARMAELDSMEFSFYAPRPRP